MRPVLLLLAPPMLLAQAPAPDGTALAWLEGTWIGGANGIHQEETWSAPAQGLVQGMFRELSGGRVIAQEYFALQRDAEGLWLLMRHFDGDLIPWAKEKKAPLRWKVKVAEPGHARFEELEGGWLDYRRDGDLLRIQLDVPRPNGGRHQVTYTLKRKTA